MAQGAGWEDKYLGIEETFLAMGVQGQREARLRMTARLLAWETGWMVTSRVISSGFRMHYLSEFFVAGFADRKSVV